MQHSLDLKGNDRLSLDALEGDSARIGDLDDILTPDSGSHLRH
ncbi:hypothetical protein [uncultured Mobiluncus sp.]|nr:hypothetical protein [uncultured Mobiluncus sp.]